MTRMRYLIALLTAPLIAGTIASQAALAEKVAQEAKHWGDPNVDYVSTAWPIEADSDLLDIREVPVLGGGFFDVAPEDRDDGVAVGELGVNGGNKEMIVGLAEELSHGQHGAVDSLLISQ